VAVAKGFFASTLESTPDGGTMNQVVKAPDMRQSMPLTTEWIGQRRAEYGREFVDGCIRAALKGEPGRFYAMEGGHVVGTPFPASDPMAHWQQYAIVCGVRFAAFLAKPEGGMTHGTD
jgi:hypothetical protein